MKRISILRITCVLCAVALIMSSCGGKKPDQSASRADISPLQCVVLLPVEIHKGDSAFASASRDNLQAGAEYLYTTLLNELSGSKVVNVVESSQIRPPISEISGGKLGTIREIGKRAQCDAVFATTLNTFRQRQGGELAVDAPASVAFEMLLIQASSGSTLWGSTFSETQTSLLNNLFSFGKARSRGFKWITVEELTAQGVNERITESPYFF